MPVWQNNRTLLNMVRRVSDCLLLCPWYIIWMNLRWERYTMFSFVVFLQKHKRTTSIYSKKQTADINRLIFYTSTVTLYEQ